MIVQIKYGNVIPILTAVVLLIFTLPLISQQSANQETPPTLTLTEAYSLLEAQYPSLQDSGIITQIYQTEIRIIEKERLPSINLNADGRLQSESPSLDLPEGLMLPFEIDLPLYAGKAYIEAQYSIYDGGINKARKSLKLHQLNNETQGLEVERYQLKDRINQLFINITLLRAQLEIFDLSIKDLNQRKANLTAAVEEGVVLVTQLNKLKVKELELKANRNELENKLKGLLMTLAVVIGQPVQSDIELIFPKFPVPRHLPTINRPEIKQIENQQNMILANSELIDAAKRPKIGAFVQGGVGYPNPLNFLDNEAAPYGIVGLKFQWPIINYKKNEDSKELLSLRSLRLDNAKETLLFNLKTKEASYIYDVRNLESQKAKLEEIALLERDILNQLSYQLDEGVINSTEYVTQMNAELRARQNILINQTKLLQLQINFWNERGALLGDNN